MPALCLGGTFNPIHHAHLICARATAEAVGFQKVLLIPSRQPPHKAISADIASPEHRLKLCELAIEGDPLFEVSDIELKRSGPSYTIDTIRELKAKGWPTIHWLIGADMVQILPKWREPEALLTEANLILLARPGWSFDWQNLPPIYRQLQTSVVQAPLIDISATDIRHRVRQGRPIDYLTPPAVVNYIRAQRLYI